MFITKAVTFPGITLALFIGILPFVTTRYLFSGAINAKFFLVFGVVLCLALHLAYMLIVRNHVISLRGRWLFFLLAGAVGVLYLTAFTGVYLGNSLFSTYLRSSGILFLTAIAFLAFWTGEFLSERDWSLVRRTIAGSATLFAFLTLLGSEGLALSGRFLSINLEIDGLTVGNSTFAGAYVLLALIITLIELFRTENYRTRYMLIILAIIQFFSPLLFNVKILLGDVSVAELVSNPFLVVGTARASAVAAFMTIGYMSGLLLIRRFISSKPAVNLAWAGTWLIALTVLIGLLFTPGSQIQNEYIEQSTAARIFVWSGAWEAFKDRPFLGWGPENFRFAHEQYVDNRLYLSENIGEVWFDRAHNIILDTLVSVGALGFLIFAMLSVYFIVVGLRAARAGLISSMEANLLGVLVVAQILQLQTAFDTVITYTLMGIMLGYALFLERQLIPVLSVHKKWPSKMIGALLLVSAAVSSIYLIGEYERQRALLKIFVSDQSREQQIVHIHTAMVRTNDFESLRLGSSSLTRGLFGELSAEEIKRNERIIRGSVEQLAIFGEYWQAHLEEKPDDYRARMNYAYQLLVRTVFGEGEHFDEAQKIIEDSYELSPGNPLTYVLNSLVLLYSGDVVGAEEKMREALALNPNIPFSQNMVKYVEEQAMSFPDITVIRLGNL